MNMKNVENSSLYLNCASTLPGETKRNTVCSLNQVGTFTNSCSMLLFSHFSKSLENFFNNILAEFFKFLQVIVKNMSLNVNT